VLFCDFMIALLRKRPGLFLLALLFSISCSTSRPDKKTPYAIDENTRRELTSTIGLEEWQFEDPTLKAIAANDKKSLASIIKKKNLPQNYPYNQYGPLQVAALLGRSDLVQLLLDNRVPVDDRKFNPFPTPLHLAIMGGHLKTMDVLLAKEANPSLKTFNDINALQMAVKMSNYEALQKIPFYRADLQSRMVNNITTLGMAASKGNLSIVVWLLDQGADIKASDKVGFTPLHHAVKNNRVETAMELIDRGADINARDVNDMTPLMIAAASGALESAALLLDRGSMVNVAKQNGMSAISYAVKQTSLDMLDLLADHQADLTILDSYGQNLFHLAAKANDPRVITWLKSKGLDINSPDNSGETPVYRAAAAKCMRAFKAFIRQGADINRPKNNGYTPLMYCVYEDREEFASELISAGADVNAKLPDGRTALTIAASRSTRSMVKELMDAGAETGVFYGEGYSLLDAAWQNDFAMFNYLLEAGIDPAMRSPDRHWLIAMDAAWFDERKYLDALFKHGIDVNITDEEGQTPLYVATRRGHTNLIHHLLDIGADPACKTRSGFTAWHVAFDLGMKEVADELASRLSPEEMAPTNQVRVYVDLDAPLATNVSVTGLFNEWNSDRHPMTRREDDGWWYTEFDVFPLTYTYKFVVDGSWITDPAHTNIKVGAFARVEDSIMYPTERLVSMRPTKSPSRADHYVPVDFTYHSRTSATVSVAGEFNGWNTDAHPMTLAAVGIWKTTVKLPPGDYAYKLIVDGRWTMDPSNALVKVHDQVTNSMISVKAPE
jgi:ankyrin repeat protein